MATTATKPPALYRINGCGTSVYGKRDVDPKTATYVKTLVVTFAFVPVFCLAAYRVADAPGSAGVFAWRDGWYFLERVPLSREAVFFNGAVSALLAVLVVAGLAR
jgi:hypothetical protein